MPTELMNPAVIMSIRSLELRAKLVVESGTKFLRLKGAFTVEPLGPLLPLGSLRSGRVLSHCLRDLNTDHTTISKRSYPQSMTPLLVFSLNLFRESGG